MRHAYRRYHRKTRIRAPRLSHPIQIRPHQEKIETVRSARNACSLDSSPKEKQSFLLKKIIERANSDQSKCDLLHLHFTIK